MNEIKIFNSPKFGEVRTIVTESGNPIFCLADLCGILDIKNVADCKSRLSEKGIVTADTPTNGGIQKMTFISESNLYKTIFQSRKPEAEEFTEWVTSEVLPAIRKTGGYIATKEEDTPETILARAILVANDSIERLKRENAEKARLLAQAQKQLEYQSPKLQYANEVLSSTTGHTATTIAAELNMSAITLNKLLVRANFQRKTGKKGEYSICAYYQGKGYVITSTHKYVREDNSVGSSIDIHFTEQGRMKIHEITGRAIAAGALEERKGRYFINHSWVPAPKQS